ncbi:CCA tRNA nucleotidyltransferase [Halobacillus litoralis]|uniref:CCA tRNA nucleotidyltransferase n=1 Tax=Halobacillus litoralis TaxID=45668 RepID=UPI001CFE1244|nr:CCA tRNA nucleotidyltransferase [Halobacillus litoralis]
MTFNTVFKYALEVIGKIENAGGEAYIVGGSVRDYLSGHSVGDIDIATSEPPARIQEIFEKVIPVGIEHGTVIVRHESNSYEVTTYRTEKGYEDFRRPDEVTFVRDIKLDLARRDFTMNAIAMNRQGQVVDPYEGQQAIKHQVICAVGDPFERFKEDPLRMMRAVRFVSQLGYDVVHETKEALSSQAELLQHISIERIAMETQKLFAGENYKKALDLLCETGLQKYLPVLNSMLSERSYPEQSLKSWHEIISFFIQRCPECSIDRFVKLWKLSNRTKKQAEQLCKALKRYEKAQKVTPWLVYQLPEELFHPFVRVCTALGMDKEEFSSSLWGVKDNLPIQTSKEMAFQARHLIALYPNRQKGPWISEIMEQIEQGIVQLQVENDYEKIKEWIKTWNPPENS